MPRSSPRRKSTHPCNSPPMMRFRRSTRAWPPMPDLSMGPRPKMFVFRCRPTTTTLPLSMRGSRLHSTARVSRMLLVMARWLLRCHRNSDWNRLRLRDRPRSTLSATCVTSTALASRGSLLRTLDRRLQPPKTLLAPGSCTLPALSSRACFPLAFPTRRSRGLGRELPDGGGLFAS